MLIQDLFSLRGKVAVVIGGGGVLAGEMAQALAGAGADIAIVGQNLEKAERRAAEIRGVGQTSVALTADASRKEDLENVLAKTMSELGRVDILINAAGINSATPFFSITEEEWQRIIDVDLKSVFLAVPGLRQASCGGRKRRLDHQHLIGFCGSAIVESLHLLGIERRSESDHAVPRA